MRARESHPAHLRSQVISSRDRSARLTIIVDLMLSANVTAKAWSVASRPAQISRAWRTPWPRSCRRCTTCASCSCKTYRYIFIISNGILLFLGEVRGGFCYDSSQIMVSIFKIMPVRGIIFIFVYFIVKHRIYALLFPLLESLIVFLEPAKVFVTILTNN